MLLVLQPPLYTESIVNGQSLDVVEELKYLRVVFDTTLSFKAHVKKFTFFGAFTLMPRAPMLIIVHCPNSINEMKSA